MKDLTQENQVEVTQGNNCEAENTCQGSEAVNQETTATTQSKTPAEDNATAEQLNLFQAAGVELPPPTPPKNKSNSKKNSCGTNGTKKSVGGSCSAGSASTTKEPDNDMERMVVLTNHNEIRPYPAEMTLAQIREDIERSYPAYSEKNTTWHVEKQEDKNRYLCIPTYKSNKAG